MTIPALSLLVNAGGQSRRMGRAKALLSVPPQGISLAAHVVNRLAPLTCAPVPGKITAPGKNVVVGEAHLVRALHGLKFAIEVVEDDWPDAGALGGIATGLGHIQSGWVMCVACDMPFVSPALMELLYNRARAAGSIVGVVPVVGGRQQPFHALYHADLAAHLAGQIGQGELRIGRALENAPILYVDESELGAVRDVARAVLNVNTPAEWEAACQYLAAAADELEP